MSKGCGHCIFSSTSETFAVLACLTHNTNLCCVHVSVDTLELWYGVKQTSASIKTAMVRGRLVMSRSPLIIYLFIYLYLRLSSLFFSPILASVPASIFIVSRSEMTHYKPLCLPPFLSPSTHHHHPSPSLRHTEREREMEGRRRRSACWYA